jgi:hypothetical protein
LPDAADIADDGGFPGFAAYIRIRAAKTLLEQGRRSEAQEQVHRALTFHRPVGATRYIRDAEALLVVASGGCSAGVTRHYEQQFPTTEDGRSASA